MLSISVRGQSDTSGPVLIQEPPNQVDFSNTTGTEIVCQARGTPMPHIVWVKGNGDIVKDVPGLRQVSSRARRKNGVVYSTMYDTVEDGLYVGYHIQYRGGRPVKV